MTNFQIQLDCQNIIFEITDENVLERMSYSLRKCVFDTLSMFKKLFHNRKREKKVLKTLKRIVFGKKERVRVF